MATTAYREEDKLGPLGAKVSAINDASDLRKTLVREFAAAVQDAKEAAATVEKGPTKAVHDARKALRRARATVARAAVALFSVTIPSLLVVARGTAAGVDAAVVLKSLVARFGGRGGGKPELAQGGGLNGGTDELVSAARE